MSQFRYEAVDARGVAQSGEIDGASRALALDALHRRGLMPLALEDAGRVARTPLFSRFRRRSAASKLAPKELLASTQSLAALLKAGLTIDRALALTASLNTDANAREVLSGIGQAVRSGRSFADALTESSVVLPSYYIGMVQAGEVGGHLPQTLLRLSELLRRQREIRERLRSALIYPALLSGVVVLTLVLLLAFVLPRFQVLFAESEAPLPLSTSVVLAVGGFVSNYWRALAIALAASVSGLVMFIRSPAGRERIDAWLLRSRLTFGVPAAIDTARMLRTLSTLLASGTQVAVAMRISRATLSNTRLIKGLDEAARAIKAGESVSGALAAAQVFPTQAVQLARVGEETGRPEEMLLEAAIILEDESQTSLERMLALLVPLLTVGMGLIVAALIGSVLIGLLSINDLAF